MNNISVRCPVCGADHDCQTMKEANRIGREWNLKLKTKKAKHSHSEIKQLVK